MNDNNSKISLVIPIYKVELYLDRCIKSIVVQTYTNLEIILVDDGSPDQCPKLCDDWEKRDFRIKVIHKPNGGLSDARNVGIEAATGDYILFVDSDDYISVDMCEKMILAAKKNNSDMVMCGFILKYPDREIRTPLITGDVERVYSNLEMLDLFFKTKKVELTVAWNKMYRRDVFFTPEHIRYPVGKLHEDEFTTYKLIYASKKITVIPEFLYYYVQRSQSIMANFGPQNLKDSILAAEEYISWSKKHHLNIMKTISCVYTIQSYGFYLRYLNDNTVDLGEKQLENFRKFIVMNTPSIYFCAEMPCKCRLWDFLLRTNTCFLFKWFYVLKKKFALLFKYL